MSTRKAVYSTSEGRALVEKILSENSPSIVPHIYQTEGICAILDGESLLATLPTGAGKTAYYSFTMIVMKAISSQPTLALEGAPKVPPNPAMLLVLPTKALQDDMVSSLNLLNKYHDIY
ncbi:hypothetical protein BJ165DRAFT_1467228 [Panaeolus papilionaceus]|nr:hypothetical protein BJ165DRAFT_1467228 [Panaeolus papilionaceus]